MPSIRKSKKNLSKNKKTHKRNNKRSTRSRKSHSVIRKMRGGGKLMENALTSIKVNFDKPIQDISKDQQIVNFVLKLIYNGTPLEKFPYKLKKVDEAKYENDTFTFSAIGKNVSNKVNASRYSNSEFEFTVALKTNPMETETITVIEVD
jgi:hypothetical protein